MGTQGDPPLANPVSKRILSPEQAAIVGSLGQGMAILAGAGSGKTTTLVAKCGRLLELNPEARLIAVSFTERSTRDLRDQLAELFCEIGQPEKFHQQWVMTIHGLCGAIIKEFPREAGLDGEESVLSETDSQRLWERALDSIWLKEIPEELEAHVRQLIEQENLESIVDLLTRIRDLASFGILTHLLESGERSAQSLMKVSEFVLERYRVLKWKQASIDFNDLELGAKIALSHPHVRESYQRRFDLILVDEFQDTNPLQAELIEQLARPDLSNLCVVGDPKQSIYRFRDADVQVFEDFCARLPLQYSLTRNFRSVPGILSWMNPLCERLFQASELRFDPLIASREDQPLIHENAVLRLPVSDPLFLARFIRDELACGAHLRDFVLLVRRIRGNEKWMKGLRINGIPLSIGSGGLFFEDPRVREMLACLRWIDTAENTFSGALFLRAPWMKIPDTTLDDWQKEDFTWRKPFFKSTHPVALALRSCFDAELGMRMQVRPGQILMRLSEAHAEIEEELSSPLLGLWHRVEELSSRGYDFHEVVEEISLASEKKRREREVPLPENVEHLSVLTLHGAKGLEFPRVILVDFEEKSRSSDAPLLFWDRKSGVHLEQRDESGTRIKDGAKEVAWRKLEREKNLAESKRLFYVALTRARDQLILVCPEPNPLTQTLSDEIILHEDDWRSWVNLGSQLKSIIPSEKLILAPEHAVSVSPSSPQVRSPHFSSLQPKQMRARHSVTEWALLNRCPRAYEWTYIRPTPVKNRVVEMQTDSQKNSQLLGTLVHRSLETGDFSALQELDDQKVTTTGYPLEQWMKESPFMQGSDPQSGRKVWTELAFEVPVGSQILVGTMDRLIRNQKDGMAHYQLIDFKMSEKRGPSRSFTRSYAAQMNLYAYAIAHLEGLESFRSIEAHLIQIFLNAQAGAPRCLRVPLGSVIIQNLAQEADSIINGKAGEPILGPYCKTCVFRFQCDAFLNKSTESTGETQYSFSF